MMERKEITVNLPGVDRPATIVLTRAGQTPPDKGDDVQVRWELRLPTAGNKYSLHKECRFGDRVDKVCGAHLVQYWGALEGPGYVARDGYTAAPTWDEAFLQAEAYVLGEINKLIKALEARQRALESAENAEDYVIGALEKLIADLKARKQAREEAD